MPLPGGMAMSVTCEVRGRRVRLLVVDGKSNPFVSRLPFLAGDRRSLPGRGGRGETVRRGGRRFQYAWPRIGFESLAAQGYTLASRSAAGWRGTFPSWLPLYDIDHVWLGPGLGCDLARCLTERPRPPRAVCERPAAGT